MVNPETEVPRPARVYDYLLGGARNLVAARAFAERLVTARSCRSPMMRPSRSA
ncbi:SAM-dependent methyltransferase [Actinokineospora spheciospongiae]|uniref:SAM-dependent methyltransferase n=1 Tax=Actinokineospora spheciospongiae TaxID=909613 RepID=UPI000D7165EA|nr:SAM-dependent methyltransferase [Actinokineospora spheciospongiae]